MRGRICFLLSPSPPLRAVGPLPQIKPLASEHWLWQLLLDYYWHLTVMTDRPSKRHLLGTHC